MGKVYEARQRAEREANQLKASRLKLPVGVPFAAVETNQPVEAFDFVDYSLKARTSDEIAQRHQDAAVSAEARRALLEPAREVTVNTAKLDMHLTTFFDNNQIASEQFNKLAIALVAEKDERPLKKLLITSTKRGEGRTCVALNLACALAQAKQRVLLIDADLKHPAVLNFLGIDAEIGISRMIKETLSPGEALIKIQPYGFDVLPVRKATDNPAEILTSPRLREVLTTLESEYDFILFDAPPLLDANITNLLVRMTNATVLVIEAGKTSSIQLSKAVASLTQDHLYGVVLNRAAN